MPAGPPPAMQHWTSIDVPRVVFDPGSSYCMACSYRSHTPMTASAPRATRAASKQVLPWLIAVAFFMEALDTTILNTAVPTIARALQVAPLSMKAVLSSYTLSLAVFIPVSGWTANRYGTRRVFAMAIGIFTLGSLLCG